VFAGKAKMVLLRSVLFVREHSGTIFNAASEREARFGMNKERRKSGGT